MNPALTWQKESAPRWDSVKQRMFGDIELASIGMSRSHPDAAIADEWWNVSAACSERSATGSAPSALVLGQPIAWN